MDWNDLSERQRVHFAKGEYLNRKEDEPFKIAGTGKIGYVSKKVNDSDTDE
ncbi:hypothetical protein LFYK43_16300 [Ligilactobacillus salitolerans]|uniref:Uncharacterized protein n=1 Tax=Ligilactobacillus salitolerans TaxID=1808352 RepID=A0A401IUF3_9LACO|nr:hypothetical protein [Ligilactobacillus salitolerans]GBG95171.1 hypothetical protein LFYK43_16300 [Ligilactobacillus salitolerans]